MADNIKNVLVTGGAGFIGSHVVDELIAAGYAVKIMDNLGPPTHEGNPPDWLNKRADFFKGDVRNKEDWSRALEGVDAVIHLAAYMDYHLDFSNYVRSNIESLILLYELIVAKKLPMKKIITASSQAVYGEGKYLCAEHGLAHPLPRSEKQLEEQRWEISCSICGNELQPLPQEEDDQLTPQTPYGISKLSSENFLFNLGRRYGLPSVALRFSIALGPRQSFRHFYSGALRAFAVNVLNNQPIQMNEDGAQTRDFISARDVAKAHLMVLNDAAADGHVFNLGSGQPTRIIDLANLVAEEAGVEFRPLLKGTYRVGDARHSVMDVSKLRVLGWQPQVSLREMVREYLAWLKQFSNLSEVLEKNYQQLSEQGILKNWGKGG